LGVADFFVSVVISEVVLGSFWVMFPGPGHKPLGQSVR